jgi:hypothetical protein
MYFKCDQFLQKELNLGSNETCNGWALIQTNHQMKSQVFRNVTRVVGLIITDFCIGRY